MIKTRAFIAEMDNWTGIYVDGKLIREQHNFYWDFMLAICEKYNLKLTDISSCFFEEEVAMLAGEDGGLPQNLSDLIESDKNELEEIVYYNVSEYL